MTKFDLDTLKSLCKSMFDHWRKAAKTDTNRCNMTVYIQNMCPHRILEDKTLEEAFTSVKLEVVISTSLDV